VHVLVTGATGLVGRGLCHALLGTGHAVTALSRTASPQGLPAGTRAVQGDPGRAGPWLEELARCDAVVNLAGAPIGERWTAERKRRIRDSRVDATALIATSIARGGPAVLVNGSAIGFYGPRPAGDDAALGEDAPAGEGFLASVVREWEEAARPAAARARVVLLRTGIVLATQGGALPRLALPFKLGVGGPVGDGSFWQSWIHLADEVGLVLWALENPAVEGPLNATAPEPVTNRMLAKALGAALHRPAAIPTPRAALRLLFGEMAELATTGQRVVPAKALALGYRFRFPAVGALANLF
jgi:uncharacterized protein (TIGR01777 family)